MLWRIGVSTSRQPASSKYSRIVEMIFALLTKVSLTCGFTMRSTYLWR